MQRAIHNHKGDVYDPFVGSRAPPLIAGEQEQCGSSTLIEIEPAYVDVTVKRWEAFTGQKAQRLEITSWRVKFVLRSHGHHHGSGSPPSGRCHLGQRVS